MAITNGYTTLAELKRFVEVDAASTAHNDDLERAIESASREIDKYCGRSFYDSGSATAKKFKARHPYTLDVPDFSTTTGLVVKVDTTDNGTFDTTLDSDDYQVEPFAPDDGKPYERITRLDFSWPVLGRRPRIEVTARWGWTAVPTDVEQTCLIVAAENWQRKSAPFGVVFGQTGEARVAATNKPILARLQDYKRKLVE